MASDALLIIAIWILTGMGLGLFATGYGACRKVYRLVPGSSELFDWLWFLLAAMGFLIILFWTEWGDFRIWSVGFVMVGYGLWTWLAAPVVLQALVSIARAEARMVHYALAPGRWFRGFVRQRIRKSKKPPRKE